MQLVPGGSRRYRHSRPRIAHLKTPKPIHSPNCTPQTPKFPPYPQVQTPISLFHHQQQQRNDVVPLLLPHLSHSIPPTTQISRPLLLITRRRRFTSPTNPRTRAKRQRVAGQQRRPRPRRHYPKRRVLCERLRDAERHVGGGVAVTRRGV